MPYSNRTMQSIKSMDSLFRSKATANKTHSSGVGTASSSARTQRTSNNGTSGIKTPGLDKK